MFAIRRWLILFSGLFFEKRPKQQDESAQLAG
jgi:hypothetical protein